MRVSCLCFHILKLSCMYLHREKWSFQVQVPYLATRGTLHSCFQALHLIPPLCGIMKTRKRKLEMYVAMVTF